MPVAQARKLLTAAEGSRFHAAYVVAATLGLRRGELLGLRWQDIDFDAETPTVDQTVPRVEDRLVVDRAETEVSEAAIPLPR
jgi:integrase